MSGNELRLLLLGQPVVTCAGKTIDDFVYRKGQALLFYLAVSGQQHSREVLASLFWPEVAEANARTHLRKAIVHLRRQVGEHLLITRQALSFDRNSRYVLDTELFTANVPAAMGRRVVFPLPEARVQQLEQAVQLYRGDFLDGFLVNGAPGFEEWVMLERERFRHAALQALDQLMRHHARVDQLEQSIEYASRLVTIEPWNEEVHRQLMRLFVLTGQRTAALRQFEACRRLLQQELGVQPEAATEALYQQILRGELTARSARPANRKRVSPPMTSLIGREKELQQIHDCLTVSSCRVLTLTGPGGVGKSHLLREAAAGLRSSFPDGVTLLQTEGTKESLLAAAIAAFDLPQQGGLQPGLSDLRRHLRRRQLLIMVDAVWLGEEDTLVLAGLLAAAPGVKALVASQRRLNQRDEWVMEIEGLPVPPRDAADIDAFAASALFLDQSRRARLGFVPDATDRAAIGHICRLVEGLPLAIILAASWVRLLSCTDIARRVEQDLDFLQSREKNLPERQRSLAALFHDAWERLEPSEQQAFRQLLTLPNPFQFEQALATGVDAVELMALADRSFLRQTADGLCQIPYMLQTYGLRLTQPEAEPS